MKKKDILHNAKGFKVEGLHRKHLMYELNAASPRHGDLILLTDVDEIVRQDTIKLFKYCKGYPGDVALEFPRYIYSFEFPDYQNVDIVGHVRTYEPGSNKCYTCHHSDKRFVLSEAGWHCSFCMRYIEDFVEKMQGYSHSDRAWNPKFRTTDHINRVVCSGADMFDMYPEKFTFLGLANEIGARPRREYAVGLPPFLLKNAERFKFLLPGKGNCVRQHRPPARIPIVNTLTTAAPTRVKIPIHL